MNNQDKYIEILLHNKGFDTPLNWVDYAIEHDFKKVKAEKIFLCHDCNGIDSKKIGQYVYYSNLISLKQCKVCGLIFSDVILSDDVSKSHFDVAYKDDKYFNEDRRQIYLQVAGLLKDDVNYNGKVLDVGGAKGHLGSIIKELRPDLKITINDLSQKACNYARSKFGFDAICCPLGILDTEQTKYDCVLLIDVLYYERDIAKAWKIISGLATQSVIIRTPNKLWLIKLLMLLTAFTKKRREKIDHIAFFNPEHIYIFRRSYLKKRLHELGFVKVKIIPSKSLVSRRDLKVLQSIFFLFAMLIYFFTFRQVVITPAQLIFAQKV